MLFVLGCLLKKVETARLALYSCALLLENVFLLSTKQKSDLCINLVILIQSKMNCFFHADKKTNKTLFSEVMKLPEKLT